MDNVEFPAGSVPVAVVARVLGKDACWVRMGIIKGWLPIGIATRNNVILTADDTFNTKRGRINYYISAQKLYEFCGYVWKGEKK